MSVPVHPRRTARRLATLVAAALLVSLTAAAPALADPPRPPTDTTSVIEVNTLGDSSERGLTGVTLQLYDGRVDGPTTPVGEPWATCVSDGGSCAFTVPDTQQGGANNGRQFWVVRTGSPTGWYGVDVLATGGQSTTANPYRFRTPGMQPRTNYVSGDRFMRDTSATDVDASTGGWQTSRVNPPTPGCGRTIALILDVSLRRTNEQDPAAELKEAAHRLVDGVKGTPSRIAGISFDSVSPASAVHPNLPVTSVATAAGASTVDRWIDSLNPSVTSQTNWDAGFRAAADLPETFDEAILVTDRPPTNYGAGLGSGVLTRFVELEEAIFSANTLKAEGTHVVAVDVQGDPNPPEEADLQAIAGPRKGTDYFVSQTYRGTRDILNQDIGASPCFGTVSVVKEVVPSTAPPGSVQGAAPAGGWTFTAATPRDSVTGTTAPETGAVTLDPPGPIDVTVTETQKPGYVLQPVRGDNATCHELGGDFPVPTTNVGDTGFAIGVLGRGAACLVYNRAPPPSLTVDKTWVIDGVSYPQADRPAGFDAVLTLDGSAHPWGSPRRDLLIGATVNVNERVTLPPGCSLDSGRVTTVNGVPADAALPYADTVVDGPNTATVTNRVTCVTRLTLVKDVVNTHGGSATPGQWTLSATGGSTQIIGASGSPEVTNRDVPPGTYTLAETGGPAGYVAGAWTCTGGPVSPAGVVTVVRGATVSCRIINADLPASLTLAKQVDANGSGSQRGPGDWTLTATPISIAGQPVVSGTGDPTSPGGVKGVSVFAGRYRLSESTVAGFTQGAWQCSGATVAGDVVTIGSGATVSCTVTNTATVPHLTLRKIVENGTSGGTAPVEAWTLTATGPKTVSGRSGVGDDVPVGTYTLTESGPTGYDASAWECTGATFTPTTVTLVEGSAATCTITNTAVSPHLTLVKKVENTRGGATPDPTAWLLSATGPTTTVSGRSGQPEVTDVEVPAGTYTLKETEGPPGYLSSGWTCPGATVAGDQLTLALGTNVTCTVTNTSQPPAWGLTKTAVPASGATVSTGGTIAYTLRVGNETALPLTGAQATDDLSDVLAKADLVTPLPAGLTLAGTTLTWAVPTVAPDGEATVTFSVTVRPSAAGSGIHNSASPASTGGHCSPCVTDHVVAAVTPPPTPPPSTPPTTPPTTPPAAASSGGGLAGTGAQVPAMLAWAALLVGIGLAAVGWARRRRT